MCNLGVRPQTAYLDEEKNDQIRIQEYVYNNKATYFFVIHNVLENKIGESKRSSIKRDVSLGVY